MLFDIRRLWRIFLRDDSTIYALSDVTLKIDLGDFVALTGPSGCGKTTLLHILGLFDTDYCGELRFTGREVRQMVLAERARLRLSRIGFVFQGLNLSPSLSVLDNVAVPHWQLNGNQRRARERARELLCEMDLEHGLERKPGRLSAGEQQRAALARALVNDPWAVLADEPIANLDVSCAHQILDRFSWLQRQGRTIVVASRDSSVERYAQRTVRLESGQLSEPPAVASAERSDLALVS